MKVKNSAIPYTGYDYQTLHGVRLLAEWLQSPSKYVRAAFEADAESNEAPSGIDDIVLERADGVVDFWQVKFTPSPEKDENGFTWGWLLKVSGITAKSRSILKKIYDAVSKVPTEKLGEVILLTNKRPDRLVESCLCASAINFDQIDVANQKEIVRQLGSIEAAKFLFANLTIQHSDGDYHTIKRMVRSELLKLSDDLGVERLLSRAREWAMFQGNPTKEGWIYLHHVREVLSPKRPAAIPEIFSVPTDYCLPDIGFHNNLVNKITASEGGVITLTGKPGAGKSTYLSFLCQVLEENEIPLVRHHYFLSLNDNTEDRLSPRVVAESLLHQVDSSHQNVHADTSKPENLREALLTCAKHYKNEGKPFVVMVDGLDHVWRDNAKNKKPLDESFRQLLPATDNLVVIIGTQPVDDELLPSLLLVYSPKHEWHWLPEMSGNSIFEFLKLQVNSGRLFLNCSDEHSNEEIKGSSKALWEITKGYPLHVIYSSEYLSHLGLPLTSWQIEKLPPCMDGNIITYYSELWRNLNYRQQDVLHLCSGFQFAWPRYAIGDVVKDEHSYAPSIDAVAHMFSEGISGVRPFHESLVVFVRNQKEHKERINALLPQVCDWLSSKAPSHLKDNWLWSSQARIGDSTPLRQGITRDWLLDRLIEGMSAKSCTRLLSEAETYAFVEGNYAEAYRHRELKTRFFNGPEFQTTDPTNLKIYSLIDADEPALNELLSGQNEYSPIELSILATALWFRGQYEQAHSIASKALQRYRTKTKLLSSRHSQSDENESVVLISISTLTDNLNYDAIFKEDNFPNWSESYIASFRRACLIKHDLDLLLRARNCLPYNSTHAGQLELDAIRLSIIEEADITCRPEYGVFFSQPLSNFLNIFTEKEFRPVTTYYCDVNPLPTFRVETTDNYHRWFFSSLCVRLSAIGDYSWIPVNAVSEDRADISEQYDLLNGLVDLVVNELLDRNTLKFDLVCSLFPLNSILDEVDWKTRRANINLKQGWIQIAADCHLVTNKSTITYDELKNIIDSNLYKIDWLRTWYKECEIQLLSENAVELLIHLELERLSVEVEKTSEKSNAYLELAQLAFQYGFSKLFQQSLRKTWDFVLGYGHHKDPTIFHVLKALDYLSNVNSDATLKLLERISPIVFNISEFTDGDDTRHSKHSITSMLAKLSPQTAASKYEQELKDGEWYYAEDTIEKLIENSNLSSPILKCLYLTGLHPECYQKITNGVACNNPHAIDIKYEIEKHLGIQLDNSSHAISSVTDDFHEKINVQPIDFPPEKFEELVATLKGKFSTGDFWKSWYSFWVEQGQESNLLKQLNPHTHALVERYDDKKYLLDLLYTSERKYRGKTKAFNLLVAAHNAMNGWSDWYDSAENSIKRLQIVAEQYPNKIDDFIKLTTIQPTDWREKFGSLIIPNDKLVFLLAHSGRAEDALQLTLAMVDSLEESTRNLKLPQPCWDWRRNDTIEEALAKSLVSRLKLPIPTIKLLILEQISQLLVDHHPKIEAFLIEDLANRKQESECVEVLCAFLVAKRNGYTIHTDLGRHINARSLLSDLLLSNLISSPKNFGTYAYASEPDIYLDEDNHRYNYFQGTHVPLLYESNLEKEERRTGIPFTLYYMSEWNNTFEYQPSSATQIDYFFSGDRSRTTGQFYTQASHRGRSAYLRTLDMAKHYFGMPDDYAAHLSISALPIEPAYIGIRPQKPLWLPEWEKDVLPDRANLTSFIKEILVNFARTNDSLDLLALSFPIVLDTNKSIDLTVVKVATNSKLTSEIKIEERSGCFSVGLLLDEKLSYEMNQDSNPRTVAFAVVPYPILRYGHWFSDLESRGLYVPNCNISDKKVIGSAKDGLFYYSIEEANIGFSSFWYSEWKPVHLKGIRSQCGTYTALNNKSCPACFEPINKEEKFLYICKALLLSSEDSYSEYELEELNFTIEC